LLKQQIDHLSSLEFHQELLRIFKSLRDLHTSYKLPKPFSGKIAFLGIFVEQYFLDGNPRWMVSKVAEHLVTDNALKEGVEITHWSGMPIELAVLRNADKEAGSNLSARRARGLETLTLRALGGSFPPDEDWVDLTYKKRNATHETRLSWQIIDGISELTASATASTGLAKYLEVPARYQIGLDERSENLRQARKQLFNRVAVKEAKRCARSKAKLPRATALMQQANILPTTRPDEITPRIVSTATGDFGYLRLWTFSIGAAKGKEWPAIQSYWGEMVRLLSDEMPPEGLIIDSRGNPGGYILAAEYLLQLLTPSYIHPEPTQFLATAGTLELAKKDDQFEPWRESLAQAVSTGALYSAGIPISSKDFVNRLGQVYFGPIVLITDAYCYSACDMFAAGFQDHNIGIILGVDERTGAGGANVLTHDQVRDSWTGGPLKKLPLGIDMNVSFRRTLRVLDREGEPVEDVGVTPDEIHRMTKNDLINGNVDLLDRAGEILCGFDPRMFSVSTAKQGHSLRLNINSLNVNSIDIYIDERPIVSRQSLADGTNMVKIDKPSNNASLRIDGFQDNELVASRLVKH